MKDKILEVLQEVFNHHKVDIVLTETSQLPDAVVDALKGRMVQNSEAALKYTELAGKVQAIGKLIEPEANLTAAEVLDRLPAIHDLSLAGAKLIDVKRLECLGWFDKATVKPEKADMSDAEKRLRGRIEASADLDYLVDLSEVYRVQAEAKFGKTDLRSSSGADDVPPDPSKTNNSVAAQSDVAYSVGRMLSKPNKGEQK